MEVKYKVNGKNCLTQCPHGMKNFGYKTMVNSALCDICQHFVRKDQARQVVICSYDE